MARVHVALLGNNSDCLAVFERIHRIHQRVQPFSGKKRHIPSRYARGGQPALPAPVESERYLFRQLALCLDLWLRFWLRDFALYVPLLPPSDDARVIER